MSNSERLPLDPFPSGWYAVAFSSELGRGEVKTFDFLGREVVAFRTESGVAAVFEAYCPHLGAHLGRGGCVVGEAVRCPMHHFQFDTQGACIATGPVYGKVPPKARAEALPMREEAGLILAFHHPNGELPTWEPPQLEDPTWGRRRHRQIVLDTHPQELAENLFDVGHLAVVHLYDDPEALIRPVVEGASIRGRNRVYRSAGFLGRSSDRVEVDLGVTVHGLGLFVVDSLSRPGDMSIRTLFAATPIGEGRLVLRITVWMKEIAAIAALVPVLRWLPGAWSGWILGELLMVALMKDVKQDKAVFDHKRFLPLPALADADVGVPTFRRWARQFYTEKQDGLADVAG